MPLFSISNNPFDDDYAARWNGAGKRAEDAVQAATEAASEVLLEEVQRRGERIEAPASVLDGVRVLPGGRVGLPTGHPASGEAREIEYGNLLRRPTGLMRSAQRKARKEAEQVFADVLHEELFG